MIQTLSVAFYKKAARLAAIVGWCLCFGYSLSPFEFAGSGSFAAGEVASLRQGAALFLHVLTFAALASLDRLGFTNRADVLAVRSVMRGLLLCVAIEVGQAFTQSRHAELLDLVMNGTGLALGHLAVRFVSLARSGKPDKVERGW